jgi:hypothetical protein
MLEYVYAGILRRSLPGIDASFRFVRTASDLCKPENQTLKPAGILSTREIVSMQEMQEERFFTINMQLQ